VLVLFVFLCLGCPYRFEHARFVLLQYKKCKSVNIDGTVDIPISVESLYGFIFAKLHAKYASAWTPRVDIDPDAEVEIESLRSLAVNSVLTKRFRRGTELSENSLNRYKAGVFSKRSFRHTNRQSSSPNGQAIVGHVSGHSRIQGSLSSRVPISVRLSNSPNGSSNASVPISDSTYLEQHPSSNNDCNINSQSGSWEFRQYPFLPLSNPIQHCCAQACSALIATIGISPTMLMMDTCCAGCNKHSCIPASSHMAAAVSLMTAVVVPELLNANVTTVTISI
jgi:hypothetical protein